MLRLLAFHLSGRENISWEPCVPPSWDTAGHYREHHHSLTCNPTHKDTGKGGKRRRQLRRRFRLNQGVHLQHCFLEILACLVQKALSISLLIFKATGRAALAHTLSFPSSTLPNSTQSRSKSNISLCLTPHKQPFMLQIL